MVFLHLDTASPIKPLYKSPCVQFTKVIAFPWLHFIPIWFGFLVEWFNHLFENNPSLLYSLRLLFPFMDREQLWTIEIILIDKGKTTFEFRFSNYKFITLTFLSYRKA